MLKRMAILVLIASLCPVAALAQRGRFGRRDRVRGGPVQLDEADTLLIITTILNMTAAQQAQLKADFDAAAKTAAPIAAQLQAGKTALFQAAESGSGDAQVQKLAAQQGALTSQILALQAQTFAKMWAQLTADQKAQVDSTMYNDIGDFLTIVNPAEAGPGAFPAPQPR